MIKLMDKVYILILMGLNMKDIGRMINKKEKEKKYGLMGSHMKEIMLEVISKEKVNSFGVMGLFMKENL